MTFFQFLQTIIATVFIFLILSLVASEIIEAFSNWQRVRAKKLKKTVANLLGPQFTNRLYEENTFLRKLSHPKEKSPSLEETEPSYIKPTDFGKAVMMLLQEDKGSKSGTLVGLIKDKTIPTKMDEKSKLFLIGLTRIIEHNQYPAEIGDDEDKKLKLEIENAFISAQERVTGDYKRWVQIRLFAVGLLIALFANTDTIHLISEFSNNPLQTQTLVGAIDEVVGPEDSLEDTAKEIEEVFKDSRGDLPIFWQDENQDNFPEFREGQSWKLAPFGFLLTAFAVMMGAPFWFDLLNKFVELRSTLKPLDASGVNKKQEK